MPEPESHGHNTIQCAECQQWCALLEVHQCDKPTFATRQAESDDRLVEMAELVAIWADLESKGIL